MPRGQTSQRLPVPWRCQAGTSSAGANADERIAAEHHAELGQCRRRLVDERGDQRRQRAMLNALTPKPGREAAPKRRRRRR